MQSVRTALRRTTHARWTIRGTTAGAALAVAILAASGVSNAAVARPSGAFPGAYWFPVTERTSEGCAQAHAFPAHWSAITGAGKMHASDSAKTCPAYRGGYTTTSLAEILGETEVVAPVTLASGSGGVNVTWNLNLAMTATGGLSASYFQCNGTWTNASYNFGYTYYNTSFFLANCEAGSNVEVIADSYLEDMTNGTETAGTPFVLFNDSGNENLSEIETATYSNATYWVDNYSYATSFNGSLGASNGVTGTYTPTSYLNGTFVAGHHYEVVTYVEVAMLALAFGYPAGIAHGASSINMATGSHHMDLQKLQVW